jgi:hypothetical protein
MAPSSSAGFEQANLGSIDKHATTRPSKAKRVISLVSGLHKKKNEVIVYSPCRCKGITDRENIHMGVCVTSHYFNYYYSCTIIQLFINVSVPSDRNVIQDEAEHKLKCKILNIEIL